MMRSFPFLSFVLAFAVVGCGDDESAGSGGGDSATSGASTTTASGSTGSEGSGGAPGFSEEDVVTAFASFTTEGFTRITDGTSPTQHGVADSVAIWVSTAAVDQYLDIDPSDEADTTPPFPEGTIIVKQNYDAGGDATGAATVLAKMEAGFAPDTGDWWWGRFGEDGALAESGVIGYCVSCHEGNGLPRTDWVQGVAADDRLP
jgi:Cytochrome P460